MVVTGRQTEWQLHYIGPSLCGSKKLYKGAKRTLRIKVQTDDFNCLRSAITYNRSSTT